MSVHPNPLSRRRAMGMAAAGGAALSLPLLGGCSDDDTGEAATPRDDAPARPRRGGTLTAALAGGGPAESLDPFSAASPADFARNRVIYDVLFWSAHDQVQPGLALSATTAPGGTSFTLKLRKGVVWHDGSPFGAKDVAFTLRYVTSPDRTYPSELSGYIDPAGIEAEDDHTLVVPLSRPIGDPAGLLAANQIFVLKDGTKAFEPGKVMGTGPLKVTDFAPGRSSTLRRFDDHWDGAPYLDELVVLSLNDPQARVNAVRSGQADFAAALPYTEAAKGRGAGPTVVHKGTRNERTGFGFMLSTGRPPFDDPRVRKAVRLAVDRQSLVDTVLLGYGEVGNDLYGAGAQYYADDLEPLARDVDQARSLLRAAGAEGVQITVRSAEIETGCNASAELFAEQMKDIGLKVKAQTVSAAEFFDVKAMESVDAVTFAIYGFPLQAIYTRTALRPSLAFDDPQFKRSLADAIAVRGADERQQAWRRVQTAMHDRGNWVVWGFADTLSLARDRVRGVTGRGTAKYPYLGKAWLA
ncbi:ABC transporter substrate-binding protein [Streptomyces sp. B93]|uniref:ABC transporter substrate-binding protein n=1 Tax=Streptomyces sp. B93 TaxID=2824875 RepID=UPI001B35FB33|nr:ABC transporter substrate-binding protein [Streptomyces sp. B93]MBQ1088246.1 ABC transporter substrate-binding protein [Streptomyces sp. B93]